MQKILILSANPTDTTRLRVEAETKTIEQAIKTSKLASETAISSKGAVTRADLRNELLNNPPDFIHFSGHSTGERGILLEDETGKADIIPNAALKTLFKLFNKDNIIQCVLLNACYAESQAKAIAEHVPYVIGMNEAIKDSTAQTFASAFYAAIGAEKDIPFAFELASSELLSENISSSLNPVMLGTATKQQLLSKPNRTPPPRKPSPLDKLERLPQQQVNNDHWINVAVTKTATGIQAEPLDQNAIGTITTPNNQFKINAASNLSELLLGEQTFEALFPNTSADKPLNIRIMTDDPELAMLPWHSIANETQHGIIETTPRLLGNLNREEKIQISSPVCIISTESASNIENNTHYSAVQAGIQSYLGIKNPVPRLSSLAQIKREIRHLEPDFIYIYGKCQQGEICLDKNHGIQETLSLKTLASCLETTSNKPLIIISTVGKDIKQYPQSLIQNSRWLWIQQSSQFNRNALSDNLQSTFETLATQPRLNHAIFAENQQSLTQHIWSNGAAVCITTKSDQDHQRQQLRAALLRFLLGRRALKETLYGAITHSNLFKQSASSFYFLAGNQFSCPFDFPGQLQERAQWHDPQKSTPMIPYFFHIQMNNEMEAYEQFDSALTDGFFNGQRSPEKIFQSIIEDNGYSGQECIINVNWLITVNSEYSQESLNNDLKSLLEIIDEAFYNAMPNNTTLLNAICLEAKDADDAALEKIQLKTNKTLRDYCPAGQHFESIDEPLGKLKEAEIRYFFDKNTHWRKGLAFELHTIDTDEYAEWIHTKTGGSFDDTIRLIWQEFQNNYQQYLAQQLAETV